MTKEICNAYTELNDHVIQKERFMQQAKVGGGGGGGGVLLWCGGGILLWCGGDGGGGVILK